MTMKLIQGDCIEKMRELEDGSIDLTVTSPPYDSLRTYNGNLEWNEDIWKLVILHLKRVTKPGGVVVWVVGDETVDGDETGTSFRQALYAKEVGFKLHDTMIYQKFGSGLPHKAHRYGGAFEFMFVFSNGKPSGRGEIKRFPSTGKVGKTTRRQKDGSIKRGTYNIGGGKLPNVWQYAGETKVDHPAPFPLQLATDHVLSWSNPGDLVLDPFLGSGTTGVACANTGRNFVGIERDPDYFAIAKSRIEAAVIGEFEI